MADERGSVVSITDSAGATIAINAYDEYGIPAPGNVGRFGYTGQTWLSEIGMWYYKARLYSPTLGRFMQTDPIGYADGMNWYNYVDSDPVNFVDPLGLQQQCGQRLIANGYTECLPDGSWISVAPKMVEVCWDNPGLSPMPTPGGPSPNPQTPCGKALAEPGEIQARGVAFNGAFVMGMGHVEGTFKNMKTGTTGSFRTTNMILGFGVTLWGMDFTTYSSLADMVGYSESAYASADVGVAEVGGS